MVKGMVVMMQVEFTNDYIKMTGHAENPIVCAMVSSLTTLLGNAVLDYLDEDAEVKLDSGDFYLSKEHLSDEAKLLTDVFEYGILGLAEDYPNSFNIS